MVIVAVAAAAAVYSLHGSLGVLYHSRILFFDFKQLPMKRNANSVCLHARMANVFQKNGNVMATMTVEMVLMKKRFCVVRKLSLITHIFNLIQGHGLYNIQVSLTSSPGPFVI